MGCKWLNLDLQKLSQLEYQWLLVDLKSVSFKSLSRKVKKSYVYIYVYIYIYTHPPGIKHGNGKSTANGVSMAN